MYTYTRNYTGKSEHVFLIWVTYVDKYSIAPVRSLIDTFQKSVLQLLLKKFGIRWCKKRSTYQRSFKIANVRPQWLNYGNKDPTQDDYDILWNYIKENNLNVSVNILN